MTNHQDIIRQERTRNMAIVTGLLSVGGILVTLFVRYASSIQYRAQPDQFFSISGRNILITAGLYYRTLSTVYLFISLFSALSVFLLLNRTTSNWGRLLMVEIYTIGVIRSIFAIFWEDRYFLFGKLIMTSLILFGLIMIYFLNRNHSRKELLLVLIQISVGIIIFTIFKIQILDPVPLFID